MKPSTGARRLALPGILDRVPILSQDGLMKTYDIFRQMEDGGAPLWVSDATNLDVAKMEAMSLAESNHAKYFVLDLANHTIQYVTEESPKESSPRH
jgi:hypothetical protein